jgi:putative transposase
MPQRKCAFIAEHQQTFAVQTMSRVLGVARSGCYAWRGRQDAPPRARQMADQQLTAAIGEVFVKSWGTYGAPRVHAALRAAGWTPRRQRVARLMKSAGRAARRKSRRTGTTASRHAQPVAANVLDRPFSARRPDEKWLADITYGATREGWRYLSGSAGRVFAQAGERGDGWDNGPGTGGAGARAGAGGTATGGGIAAPL